MDAVALPRPFALHFGAGARPRVSQQANDSQEVSSALEETEGRNGSSAGEAEAGQASSLGVRKGRISGMQAKTGLYRPFSRRT